MDAETTVARSMTLAENKAQYDAACKKLLSEKIILAWMMRDCVEEFRGMPAEEIAEKYIESEPQIGEIPVMPDGEIGAIHGLNTEDKTLHEGTVYYDIRFIATAPGTKQKIKLIVNVEAQNKFRPGYPLIKRGIYYGCRMISSQYGTEFVEPHYENIKKVYSIWVCMNPPKNRENTIVRYGIREEAMIGTANEFLSDYDLMTVIMVCLGSGKEKNDNGILRLLSVLFSSEMATVEKKQVLSEDYQIKMSRTIESEVSKMCNLSEGVYERGLEKGILQGMIRGREEGIARGREEGIARGREEGIARGREEGLEVGREEGRAEGRQEGAAETMLHSIKSLTESIGVTVEEAMEMLKVPEEQRETFRQKLEKQM